MYPKEKPKPINTTMKITYRISKDKVVDVRASKYTGENHVAEVCATSNEDYTDISIKVTTLNGTEVLFGFNTLKDQTCYEYDEDDGSIIEEYTADVIKENDMNKESYKALCNALKEENEWLKKDYIVNRRGIFSNFTASKLHAVIFKAYDYAIKSFNYDTNKWDMNEKHVFNGKLLFDEHNDLWLMED